MEAQRKKLMEESRPIEFYRWLQHLDNGTTHYNPYTKEETESIGFSPYDCLVDGIYTVDELYEKYKLLNK